MFHWHILCRTVEEIGRDIYLTLHASDLPGEAGLQRVGHGGVEGGGPLLLTTLLVLPLGEHAGLVYTLLGLSIESYI